MKIIYNKEVDIAYIDLESSQPEQSKKVSFSKEFDFGVIDYGFENEVLGIEIMAFMKTIQLIDITIPEELLASPQ